MGEEQIVIRGAEELVRGAGNLKIGDGDSNCLYAVIPGETIYVNWKPIEVDMGLIIDTNSGFP